MSLDVLEELKLEADACRDGPDHDLTVLLDLAVAEIETLRAAVRVEPLGLSDAVGAMERVAG